MSNHLTYRVIYPSGFEVAITSLKEYQRDIADFLKCYPKEVVKVYRGQKLYCKYGLLDGDFAQTRYGV